MSIRKKRVRRLALTAYAALVCAAASSQTLSPALYLPISASVVRVLVDREQGGLSVGSGVTVAPSVVATSCHVVREAIGIRISGSGSTWNVDGEHADLRRDICFLRVPAWSGKPVPFANANDLRPGAPVAALGFTGGAAITPRFGQVLALHAYDEGRIIESSAPFNSGSSGGGLFDAGGALIGLLTFRLRNSEVSYYSVPVQWIREALPAESQWKSVHPLEATTPFWQGEPEELPYFMRIKALEAQGAWARALELADKWASTSPDDPSAWYGLALAAAQAGDAVASRRAEARLDALDHAMATELAARLSRE
jgi:hypothetical protein